MRQLHEILWYLTEAFRINYDSIIQAEIGNMISETLRLTNLDADPLMNLDLVVHRNKVNAVLLKTSELMRSKALRGKKTNLKRKNMIGGRLNFIGSDLKKGNLTGENLSGALLIAADLRDVDLSNVDLIGADLRDADISGANLTNSIFITQAQINAAKGDSNTKLPISLVNPTYWEK